MKILVVYRAAQRILHWETGALLADAFRELGHSVDEHATIYETGEVVASMDEEKIYDLVVVMEMNDPMGQPLEVLQVTCKKRVYWTFDCSYYLLNAIEIMHRFDVDHVFCGNFYLEKIIQQLLGKPTSFLPYAAAKDHHYAPVNPQLKKYDVTLIGTERPERRALIKTLKDNNISAHLISDVFKEDYVKALNESWIVVNQNPPEGRGLLNMRTFEAPAAGALCIHQQEDGLDYCFGDYHMERYNPLDVTSLSSLCYHKLRHKEDSLPDLIANQQEYVMENHTYLNRAKTILETVR